MTRRAKARSESATPAAEPATRPPIAQRPTLRLTGAQVLTWRLRRHLLEPVGDLAAPEVVERLCGVKAQVPSSAELGHPGAPAPVRGR
jgi:hypothetical protein